MKSDGTMLCLEDYILARPTQLAAEFSSSDTYGVAVYDVAIRSL